MMVFNTSKSMVLRIGNRFDQICTPVNVGGNNIPFVLKAKYLDFFVQQSSLKSHTMNLRLCLYRALILMDYCISLNTSKMRLSCFIW